MKKLKEYNSRNEDSSPRCVSSESFHGAKRRAFWAFGGNMLPKVGEPVLIGTAKEVERDNPFASVFGGSAKMTIGGDRSYSHDVWVCLSVEEDRCIVMKLCRKGEKPGQFNFGSREPYMIHYEEYPIMKCSEQTLRAMTGYELTDDLMHQAHPVSLSRWLCGANSENIVDGIEKLVHRKLSYAQRNIIKGEIFEDADNIGLLGVAHTICDYVGVPRRGHRYEIQQYLKERREKECAA
jgi:hypothetical protein